MGAENKCWLNSTQLVCSQCHRTDYGPWRAVRDMRGTSLGTRLANQGRLALGQGWACLVFLVFWKFMDLTDLSAAEIFISLSSIMVLERKSLIIEIMIIKATY